MSSLTDFRATDVRDRMSNVVSPFAEQLAGAAKNTERLVRSNPWQAVGAIAVVGLAAGILVGRGARRVRRFASDRSSASSEVSGG